MVGLVRSFYLLGGPDVTRKSFLRTRHGRSIRSRLFIATPHAIASERPTSADLERSHVAIARRGEIHTGETNGAVFVPVIVAVVVGV